MKKVITVIGLGNLGLPYSLLLAEAGYKVHGYDVDSTLCQQLKRKTYFGTERGVQSLLKQVRSFHIVSTLEEAITDSDIIFICVPTMTTEEGAYDHTLLWSVINDISKYLSRNKLVVIKSNIMPGTMNTIKFELEEKSKLTCGVNFNVYYSPDFAGLGEMVHSLANPDFILIGELNHHSQDIEEVELSIVKNNARAIHTSFENAELARLFIGNFLTVKMSYGNMMSEFCEKISGADIEVVSRIMEKDHRIGSQFINGGLSYGGPYLGKDNDALKYLSKKLLFKENWMIKAAEDINNLNEDRVMNNLREIMAGSFKDKNVAVLGLSYKPGTPSVYRSGAVLLVLKLLNEKAIVSVHDPQSLNAAKSILGDTVVYCSNIKDCLNNTDLCIIAVPWDEYKYLTQEDFVKSMRTPIVYDCWRILKNHTAGKTFGVFLALGRKA